MKNTFVPSPSLPPEDFNADFWSLIQKETRPIILYGMGNGADKLIDRLAALGKKVADFFASDGFVRGQSFHGKKVLSLSEVSEKYDDFVILVSFGSHIPSVVRQIYSIAEKYTLYIPDMPLASDAYFDAAFYRAHYREILRAYEFLADEASRRVYTATVWYKLTADPHWLQASVFFEDEKPLCDFPALTCAVDVGAYRGDTLKELCDRAAALKVVYAVEPDRKNFQKLEAVASTVKAVAVHCVHAAAWDEDTELFFDASGNRNAAVADPKTNLSSYEHKREPVKASKIDTLISGRHKIDYIKYDTEGAEREAILGSFETIKASFPTLLVSAYHKSEDIFSLLLLLEEAFPCRYSYYFRRNNCIPAWDLNLIARKKNEEET